MNDPTISQKPPRAERVLIARYVKLTSCEMWLVLWPNGDIRRFATPEQVLGAVERNGLRIATEHGLCLTRLEWENVPPHLSATINAFAALKESDA